MAVDVFLKLGDIKGTSIKGEIEVLSFSWGLSQQRSTGGGGGGGVGKVQVQDFSFVKALDGSSGEIMEMVCTGKHVSEASLRVAKAGSKEQLEFLKIKMSDVLITSYQTGGAAGGQLPVEQISFAFQSIEIQARNEKGQFEPATSCNFGSNDLASNHGPANKHGDNH